MKFRTKIVTFLFFACGLSSLTYGMAPDNKFRKAVRKRLDAFKQTGLKEHLNLPFTKRQLNMRSDESLPTYDPLGVLVGPHRYDPNFPEPFVDNKDLIYELLIHGAQITQSALVNAVKCYNVPVTLLLLHHVPRTNLNIPLGTCINLQACKESIIEEQHFKILKLLLSYGAQPNSRNREGETVLFEMVKELIDSFTHPRVFCMNGERYPDIRLKADVPIIKYLVKCGANPYIKDIDNQSCFDLLNDFKNVNKYGWGSWVRHFGLNTDQSSPISEQTKKEFDELAQLFKKSVDERIDRMTDFLHTRALKDEAGLRQTPFKVKDIAQKIAEHVYKNDIHA